MASARVERKAQRRAQTQYQRRGSYIQAEIGLVAFIGFERLILGGGHHVLELTVRPRPSAGVIENRPFGAEAGVNLAPIERSQMLVVTHHREAVNDLLGGQRPQAARLILNGGLYVKVRHHASMIQHSLADRYSMVASERQAREPRDQGYHVPFEARVTGDNQAPRKVAADTSILVREGTRNFICGAGRSSRCPALTAAPQPVTAARLGLRLGPQYWSSRLL